MELFTKWNYLFEKIKLGNTSSQFVWNHLFNEIK